MACPRCASSPSHKTCATRSTSPVSESMRSDSRTTAIPVVLLPGSIFTRTGWVSPPMRSFRRMVKGARRTTTARPRCNSNRARFSEHGISGFFCLSKTKTAMSCLQIRAPTGLVTEPCGSLPSGLLATGSRLAAAIRTFGALPFASMILIFQCPGLRKHPGVGLNDLLPTERIGYRFPWSTQLLQAPPFRAG